MEEKLDQPQTANQASKQASKHGSESPFFFFANALARFPIHHRDRHPAVTHWELWKRDKNTRQPRNLLCPVTAARD